MPERFGLVGESGSGKSTTVLALMRLIKSPAEQVYSRRAGKAASEGMRTYVRNLPAANNYLVGFRGTPGTAATAANDSAANAPAANSDAEKDRALQIAVGVVRELPVAQL